MTTVPKKKITKSRKTTPIVDLPNNALAFEVLHLASKQRSKAKKVQILKKYEHESLKTIFVWNFDTSIISALPEGEVPYTGYDDQNTYSGTLSTKIDEQIRSMHETGSFSIGASDRQGHTTIRREFKNFYHFVKGGNDAMNNIRRETMFINILEGLHPLEAEIVCLCKDKRLTEKYNITKDVVSQAYPEIHWGDS
jgi:hypothetical protein|tara:strand:- start:122 stop:706 length:585 start_codon:yes stop_codon:yes gene_type:complete